MLKEPLFLLSVPVIVIVVAVAVWLLISRRLKRNLRPGDGSLLSREKELTFLEANSDLTPEEKRKIRLALAKKMKENDEEEESRVRKPPIDIRELEDRYLGRDK